MSLPPLVSSSSVSVLDPWHVGYSIRHARGIRRNPCCAIFYRLYEATDTRIPPATRTCPEVQGCACGWVGVQQHVAIPSFLAALVIAPALGWASNESPLSLVQMLRERPMVI